MSITPSRMPPMPKTKPPKQMHPTNCRNCGAPIHGSVCEYCGTEYGEAQQMVLKVNTAKLKAETMRRIKELEIGGMVFLDSSIESAYMPTIIEVHQRAERKNER